MGFHALRTTSLIELKPITLEEMSFPKRLCWERLGLTWFGGSSRCISRHVTLVVQLTIFDTSMRRLGKSARE